MTREEFSRHVVDNYDTLLHFVRIRGLNAADAEDVLQQCLLKLMLVCDVIDAARPDGFFFAVLKNTIVDYWRKRGRQPHLAPLPEQLVGPDLPDAIIAEAGPDARCRALLAEAVAGLTPHERRALTAYWGQRGRRPDVLAALGLTRAGQGERHRLYDGPLYRARRKLALALLPSEALLADVGRSRCWRLLNDVLSGTAAAPDPEAPPVRRAGAGERAQQPPIGLDPQQVIDVLAGRGGPLTDEQFRQVSRLLTTARGLSVIAFHKEMEQPPGEAGRTDQDSATE
jgi:hypothetical protein